MDKPFSYARLLVCDPSIKIIQLGPIQISLSLVRTHTDTL